VRKATPTTYADGIAGPHLGGRRDLGREAPAMSYAEAQRVRGFQADSHASHPVRPLS
jgi:hypothetical protein